MDFNWLRPHSSGFFLSQSHSEKAMFWMPLYPQVDLLSPTRPQHFLLSLMSYYLSLWDSSGASFYACLFLFPYFRNCCPQNTSHNGHSSWGLTTAMPLCSQTHIWYGHFLLAKMIEFWVGRKIPSDSCPTKLQARSVEHRSVAGAKAPGIVISLEWPAVFLLA